MLRREVRPQLDGDPAVLGVEDRRVFCASAAGAAAETRRRARGAAAARTARQTASWAEFSWGWVGGRLRRRGSGRPGARPPAAARRATTSPPIAAIWRTSVAVMGRTPVRGRQEHGLDLGRHGAVHAGELHLVVEVGAVAQAPDEQGGAVAPGRGRPRGRRRWRSPARVPSASASGAQVARSSSARSSAREHRRLARMHADGDDEVRHEPAGLTDDVEVSVGDRVEGAGIERGADHREPGVEHFARNGTAAADAEGCRQRKRAAAPWAARRVSDRRSATGRDAWRGILVGAELVVDAGAGDAALGREARVVAEARDRPSRSCRRGGCGCRGRSAGTRP